MAGKKKALYTYLTVKELEVLKIIVAERLNRERALHASTTYEGQTGLKWWAMQQSNIAGLEKLIGRIEQVRVKTCYIDEEYKKEVENGQYN